MMALDREARVAIRRVAHAAASPRSPWPWRATIVVDDGQVMACDGHRAALATAPTLAPLGTVVLWAKQLSIACGQPLKREVAIDAGAVLLDGETVAQPVTEFRALEFWPQRVPVFVRQMVTEGELEWHDRVRSSLVGEAVAAKATEGRVLALGEWYFNARYVEQAARSVRDHTADVATCDSPPRLVVADTTGYAATVARQLPPAERPLSDEQGAA